MDPLTITVSILALLKTSRSIYKFGRAASKSQEEIEPLLHELVEVEAVVSRIKGLLETYTLPADNAAVVRVNDELKKTLQQIADTKLYLDTKLYSPVQTSASSAATAIAGASPQASSVNARLPQGKAKPLSIAKRKNKIKKKAEELCEARQKLTDAFSALHTLALQTVQEDVRNARSSIEELPRTLLEYSLQAQQVVLDKLRQCLNEEFAGATQRLRLLPQFQPTPQAPASRLLKSPPSRKRRVTGVSLDHGRVYKALRQAEESDETDGDDSRSWSTLSNDGNTSDTASVISSEGTLLNSDTQAELLSVRLERLATGPYTTFEASSSWFPETYTQKTRVPRFLCARYYIGPNGNEPEHLEWHVWWRASARDWRMIRITYTEDEGGAHLKETLSHASWNPQYLWTSPTQLQLPCPVPRLEEIISDEAHRDHDVINLSVNSRQPSATDPVMANESRPYQPDLEMPPTSYRSANYLMDVEDLGCRVIQEREVVTERIISGFTARVIIDGKPCVEKKLPLAPFHLNPFLYELKAVWLLRGCTGIVDFIGVKVDNERKRLQGFIRGCEDDDLSQVLQDRSQQGQKLSWSAKERWAGQLIQGVYHAHAKGLVIGTLDPNEIGIHDDQARILHVGHGVCPLSSGCLAPELRNLVANGRMLEDKNMTARQDVFALGLVLWIIAWTDYPQHLDVNSRLRGRRPWWKQLFCRAARCRFGNVEIESSACTDEHVDPIDLPPLPPSVPIYYQHIINRCRATLPQQRATAGEVKQLYKRGAKDLGRRRR